LGEGNEGFWQEKINYRIYKIERMLGRCAHDNLPQLLEYAGFETTPTEIVAPTNAFVRFANEPAFFLPIGGYMRLNSPKGATTVEGKFGVAISDTVTRAADFRIEEEMADGNTHLLQSHVVKPGEYYLKEFSVSLSGEPGHRIILRTAAAQQLDAAKTGEKEQAAPITCWANLRFR
jgi:hypothetical protein